MNDKPLVSIAVCTYNGERFLEEQLDSLIEQTYRPMEIIVVDDGSIDRTPDILADYEKKHDIFNVYFNEVNLGYCKNFEKALGLCSGKYIALCDQDDIWRPEKIATFVHEIGGRSLIYSTPSYIDQTGTPANIQRPVFAQPVGRCPLGLIFSFPITGHLSMVTREVLDHALPFPATITQHDYWLPLVAATLNGLKPIDQVLSYYRIHGENVSFRKRKKNMNPIKQIGERRDRIRTRLERRIATLECVHELSLLSAEERMLIAQLLAETRKLMHCFINLKLKKLLHTYSLMLFPYCKKPAKMPARLSRGLWYYRSLLFLNRN